MTNNKFLTLFAVTAVLTGCGTTNIPAPKSWATPLPVPVGHCPNLTGEYANEGKTTNEYDQRRDVNTTLSGHLIKYYAVDIKGPTTVSLKQDGDNVLLVTVKKDGETLKEGRLTLAGGDFTCNSEGLWLTPLQSTSKDGTGVVHASWAFGFNAASNHSLVAIERRRNTGLALWLIPVGNGQEYALKWDAANQSQ